MTIFDRNPDTLAVNKLAYGGLKRITDPVVGGQLFRLERGSPYYRAGVAVKAVPQFRALNIFSPTTKNSLLPTISVTPTQIAYPVKVK